MLDRALHLTHALRPLCQTRWTCREGCLQSVLDNYGPLRSCLDDMAESSETRPDLAALASGFSRQMESFDFLFGLCMGLHILRMTQPVVKAMQAHSRQYQKTFNLAIVETLRNLAVCQRDRFDDFWERTEARRAELDVGEPKLPRRVRPPRRLDEGAPPYHPPSAKDLYRRGYGPAIH